MRGHTDILDSSRWRELWYADCPRELTMRVLVAHAWVVLAGALVVVASAAALWGVVGLWGTGALACACIGLVFWHLLAGEFALFRDSLGLGQRRGRIEAELGGWRKRHQALLGWARLRAPWLSWALAHWGDSHLALWACSGVAAHGTTVVAVLMLWLMPPAWGAFWALLAVAVALWAAFGLATMQRTVLWARRRLAWAPGFWEQAAPKGDVAWHRVATPMVPGRDWRWETLRYAAEPRLSDRALALHWWAIAAGAAGHAALLCAWWLWSLWLAVLGLVVLASAVAGQVLSAELHRRDALRGHGWSHSVARLVRYARLGDEEAQGELLELGKWEWDQMQVLAVSSPRWRERAMRWDKEEALRRG